MAGEVREAFGRALRRYGGADPRVVVLSADVASSCLSSWFAADHPERSFNVGVAEAGMAGIAAGLAATGKIAFINTYAVFMETLALSPIRGLAAHLRLDVKLCGGNAGLSDSFDGPSHHSLEDIAVMRAIPNMTVLVASDAACMDWMVKAAIDTPGPVYLRINRNAVPDIHPTGAAFAVGRGVVVREGDAASVIACGYMVAKALEAAALLAGRGIAVRVVDMHSVKPLDGALVRRCARETGCIVTAEEHSVIGGLGGAVAEELARSGTPAAVDFAGIEDCVTETGPHEELLARHGLDGAGIAARVERALARKFA